MALAFITYARALDNFFIADDFNWVYEAARTWAHPANVFSLVIANFFRPVVHVWFAILRRVAGLDPTVYYAAAILLHGLNGGVVAWATGRLTGDRWAGVIAGAVFVVHFTHFDAVYWLSAVSDLIGTTLTVVAIVGAAEAARGARGDGWTALFLTPLILMCKESMVMVVPLLVWTVWMFRRPEVSLRRQAPWLLPAAGIWVAYLIMQRAFQAASPHVTTGYWSLGWHAPRMLINALINFVIPNRYVVPAPGWMLLPVAGLLLAVGREACGWLRPGGGRFALFLLGWMVLAFVPCSFFQNYDRIPSRYSYLPSVAFAMLVGWLGAAWWKRAAPMTPRRRARTLVTVVIVALMNIAYVWRVDRVRYAVHSRASREVVWRLNHDRRLLTADTTVVIYNLGPPHRGLHFVPALALFVNRPVRDIVTVAPGAPAPSDLPAPVLRYRWDAARERLVPLGESEPAA